MPPEWKDLKRDTHTFIYICLPVLSGTRIFSALGSHTQQPHYLWDFPLLIPLPLLPLPPYPNTHTSCTVISEGWELPKREEHHRASSASQLCLNFSVRTLSCFQKYWRAQCSSFPSLFIPPNLITIYQWAHTDFKASVQPNISSAETAIKNDISPLLLPRFPITPLWDTVSGFFFSFLFDQFKFWVSL